MGDFFRYFVAFSEYLNFTLEKGMFFFKMCLLRHSVFVDYRGRTNLCQKNSNYSFKYAADISNNSINEFSRYNTSSKLKVRSNEHYLITYVPYVTRVLSKVIIKKSRGGRFLWNRNWDLGWIWAGWHYRKKKYLGRLWATFEVLFFMFSWAKKIKLL